MQGAFRQVAVEADACAKELTLILKQRMVSQKDQAAECIQMVRKLGEPIESLQVLCFWLLSCLFACLCLRLWLSASLSVSLFLSVCLPACRPACLPAGLSACQPNMALCELKRMQFHTSLLHLSGAMSALLFAP